MTTLELFRCEPLRARITSKTCATNYRHAQLDSTVTRGEARRTLGLGPCRVCAIGRAHAAGETTDVIRTPVSAPASKEPREEPPMPPTHNDERKRLALEACLRKDRPILEVGREHGFDQATLRKWLEREGHDPKTWPKMRREPGARRPPAPPKAKPGEEPIWVLEERAKMAAKEKALEERIAKAAETTGELHGPSFPLDEARKASGALVDVFLGRGRPPAPLVVELDSLPHRVALAISELAQGRLEEAKKHIAALEAAKERAA